MKKNVFFLAAAIFALIVSGCGGGDGGNRAPTLVSDNILSAGGNFDGDITYDPILASYTLFTNAAVDNVVVGTAVNPLDPLNPASDQVSKGYLTFSLSSIPPGASIQDARLFLRINAVEPDLSPSVSVTPSMVSFSALNLLGSAAIATLFSNSADILVSPVSYAIFPADVGSDSPPAGMDVTDALIEARRLGFSTVQIKLKGTSGSIVIDDMAFPPMLQVDYLI